MRLTFSGFVLDPGPRQLTRGGEVLRLGPHAFALLEVLLRNRPNVVTKEAIRARLWPGTFVTESTLATVVAEVRTALGDDARSPRFVRTVHGVGYAFCAEAAEEPPRPAGSPRPRGRTYRLLLANREVTLDPGENLLGRLDEGVVWLDSPSVSRRHARLRVEEDGAVILEDLGSKNGTFWRGQRITAPVVLADGDEFRLGQFPLRLRILAADVATRTDEGGGES